jgi:DNA end-binding protein Ku
MASRSSWKGFLKLSLISLPVKAYTATASGGGAIHLNQIHAPCHNRIQYKKTCPVHGEVKADEIVSGYEFAKGQYVLIDPEELDKLRSADDKAIKIDTFIKPDAIDPIYYGDKTYYLVPDGPVGQKPYAVLHQGMVELNRYAIAQVVFHGKEQVVLLRPVDGLITMNFLYLDAEINKPSAFEDEVQKAAAAPEELTLIKQLINAQTTEKLDYARYKDVYTEKLTQLIQAKVEGKEIVAPPAVEQAQVINLMDALRQSVAQLQGAAAPAQPAAKPPKKMAASVKKGEAARKKKQA